VSKEKFGGGKSGENWGTHWR